MKCQEEMELVLRDLVLRPEEVSDFAAVQLPEEIVRNLAEA